MNCEVFLIAEAEDDVLGIFRYIAANDSASKAAAVIANIRKTCMRLTAFPGRGGIPPELRSVGVMEYREILFKAYRIVYQATGDKVYIHCVLDGRRDLKDLLEQRLNR